MASHGIHLNVVEQALGSLKKMDQYIATGMTSAEDIAIELTETDNCDSSSEVNELRKVMADFAQMDNQLKQFLHAMDHVKTIAKDESECGDLEKILKEKLSELQKSTPDPTQHEKFLDMEEKIQASLQGEDSEDTAAASEQPASADDDLVMTQKTVNTRCPYTGQEMKDPVKNTVCGHSYDRIGILELIKSRRGHAKCPVGGCPNTKLQEEHLVPNKELKNFILRNAKSSKRRTQKT